MTDTLAAILAQAGPMGPMGGGYGPMGGGYGPMHGWGAMGAGSMGAGWWGFLTLLLLVLAAGVLVSLARRGAFGSDDDAITELRRAYARGDLSDEEYERRRARLS